MEQLPPLRSTTIPNGYGPVEVFSQKAHSSPGIMFVQEPSGMIKKIIQQGRSHLGARSVLPVREHGKMARTPLVAFCNIPIMYYFEFEAV